MAEKPEPTTTEKINTRTQAVIEAQLGNLIVELSKANATIQIVTDENTALKAQLSAMLVPKQEP